MLYKKNHKNYVKWAESSSSILRIAKIILGAVLVVSFFLPWAVKTEGCADSSAIVDDNITGLSLVTGGIARSAIIAPISGIFVIVVAFFVIGTTYPLIRSLMSLGEIMAIFFSAVYLSFEIFFFTHFKERIGFFITYLVMAMAIPIVSFLEVFAHFPLLQKKGKYIVTSTIALLILLIILNKVIDGI